jgi:hypothetical protein
MDDDSSKSFVVVYQMNLIDYTHLRVYFSSDFAEIPKHAGPTDKSGKNQFGPKKHWFPPYRLSVVKYWVCCTNDSSKSFVVVYQMNLIDYTHLTTLQPISFLLFCLFSFEVLYIIS